MSSSSIARCARASCQKRGLIASSQNDVCGVLRSLMMNQPEQSFTENVPELFERRTY